MQLGTGTMSERYNLQERLYGLLMVSVIIWSLFTILAIGQILLFTNPAIPSTSEIFSFLFFFVPIFLVCLTIGLPSWWIAQKLGFDSKISATITGVISMLFVLFALTGFDFSLLLKAGNKDYFGTTASFAIFGAVCGFVARIFAERARIRNDC